MGDGSLSQQEIDALLEGVDLGGSSSSDFGLDNSLLSPEPATQTATQVVKSPAKKQSASSDYGNLDLLLDVTMNLTVELGRTRLQIKDVLEFGDGSIVELDKFIGEPVDILVNNRMFARGEVVAIDESFGVKVTEIIDPEERFKIGM